MCEAQPLCDCMQNKNVWLQGVKLNCCVIAFNLRRAAAMCEAQPLCDCMQNKNVWLQGVKLSRCVIACKIRLCGCKV